MDPNAALELLRKLARKITFDDDLYPDDVEDLATEFIALDEWISKGGFLPNDWERRS